MSQSLLSVLAPSSNSLLSANFAVENTLTLFTEDRPQRRMSDYTDGSEAAAKNEKSGLSWANLAILDFESNCIPLAHKDPAGWKSWGHLNPKNFEREIVEIPTVILTVGCVSVALL